MVVATTPAASRRFRHDLKNSTRNTWSDFRGAVDGGDSGGGAKRRRQPLQLTKDSNGYPRSHVYVPRSPFVWMISSVFKCPQPHRNRLVKSR